MKPHEKSIAEMEQITLLQSYKNKIDQLKKEKDDLLDRLKNQRKKAEEDNARLASQGDIEAKHARGIEQDKKKISAQLAEYKEKANQLENDYKELKAQLIADKGSKSEQKKLISQLNEYKEQVRKVEEESTRRSGEIDRFKGLATRAENASSSLAAQLEESKRSQQKNTELYEAKIKQAEKDKKEYLKTISNLEKEKKSRNITPSSDIMAKEYQSTIESLKTQINEIRLKHNEHKKNFEQLTRNYNRTKEDLSSLRKKINCLEGELKSKKIEEKEKKTSNNVAMEKEIKDLRQEKARLEGGLKTMQDENKRILEGLAEEINEKTQLLKNQAKQFADEIKDKNEELSKQKRILEEIKRNYSASEEKLKKLANEEKSIEATKEEPKNLIPQISEHIEKITNKYEQERKQMLLALSQAEERINHLNDQILLSSTAINKERETLQQKLEAASQEIALKNQIIENTNKRVEECARDSIRIEKGKHTEETAKKLVSNANRLKSIMNEAKMEIFKTLADYRNQIQTARQLVAEYLNLHQGEIEEKSEPQVEVPTTKLKLVEILAQNGYVATSMEALDSLINKVIGMIVELLKQPKEKIKQIQEEHLLECKRCEEKIHTLTEKIRFIQIASEQHAIRAGELSEVNKKLQHDLDIHGKEKRDRESALSQKGIKISNIEKEKTVLQEKIKSQQKIIEDLENERQRGYNSENEKMVEAVGTANTRLQEANAGLTKENREKTLLLEQNANLYKEANQEVLKTVKMLQEALRYLRVKEKPSHLPSELVTQVVQGLEDLRMEKKLILDELPEELKHASGDGKGSTRAQKELLEKDTQIAHLIQELDIVKHELAIQKREAEEKKKESDMENQKLKDTLKAATSEYEEKRKGLDLIVNMMKDDNKEVENSCEILKAEQSGALEILKKICASLKVPQVASAHLSEMAKTVLNELLSKGYISEST